MMSGYFPIILIRLYSSVILIGEESALVNIQIMGTYLFFLLFSWFFWASFWHHTYVLDICPWYLLCSQIQWRPRNFVHVIRFSNSSLADAACDWLSICFLELGTFPGLISSYIGIVYIFDVCPWWRVSDKTGPFLCTHLPIVQMSCVYLVFPLPLTLNKALCGYFCSGSRAPVYEFWRVP